MCWFHFKINIRKHKNLVSATKVLSDIYMFYIMCDSEKTYNLLLKLTLRRWTKDEIKIIKFLMR